MLNQIIKSTLLITLFMISIAEAHHNSVVLGTIQLGGSCKESSVSTRIDRTTGHFVVVPENYVALIENGASFARKTCLFSIPFEGKANRAVRIRLPKLKGVVALDQGSKADINYEIFFAGITGEKTLLSFVGEENILQTEFNELSSAKEVVYGCGKSGIIRGNSSILVSNTNANSQIALAHVQKFGIKIDSVPCE